METRRAERKNEGKHLRGGAAFSSSSSIGGFMARARESEEVSMLETLRGDEARSGARGERRAGATSRITRRNGSGGVYCLTFSFSRSVYFVNSSF